VPNHVGEPVQSGYARPRGDDALAAAAHRERPGARARIRTVVHLTGHARGAARSFEEN
jgi:hypothetical protein